MTIRKITEIIASITATAEASGCWFAALFAICTVITLFTSNNSGAVYEANESNNLRVVPLTIAP
jgi:hypothetical protein